MFVTVTVSILSNTEETNMHILHIRISGIPTAL